MDAAQDALQRRDTILSALTQASETFLRGSLSTWQENVLQVLNLLGHGLGVTRIFVCKHEEVTAEKVVTSTRYEWVAEGNQTRVNVEGQQRICLQERGFSRWAGPLYRGEVLECERAMMPESERGSFLSETFQGIIVVPVFVEQTWWGFIGFEDYYPGEECSLAELDAFKTIAVTFGAAIRRKRMEESLEREKHSVEAKAREVADVARFPAEDPSPVLRVSETGMVLYANRAAQKVLDFWQLKIGDGVSEEWRQKVGAVLETQEMVTEDVAINGTIISLQLVPIKSEGYVNLYGRDVTREREAEQLKTEFFSMASHQLRTPLTSMRWYSELLLKNRDGLSEKQVNMAEVIHTTSVHLAELVNDLLGISRIDKGTLSLQLNDGALPEVVGDAVNQLKGQAEKQGVQLVVDIQGEIPGFKFDSQMVRQVVVNLISNAIKYSPSQSLVTIRVWREGQGSVICEVKDKGMGIAENEKSKVFQKFFRSDLAVSQGIEGTGLGLSLAKMIIERSGGEIWFDSKEGEGSTFSFRLPLQPPQEV
jgi:signal transduction histidine kinase